MLRLEPNTRAIDHNVIAQSSTNNGGMDFHSSSMAAWWQFCKPLNYPVLQKDKSDAAETQLSASR